MYSILADIVLALHFIWVAIVVFGQIAILIGAWRKWLWVFNPWFRWIHLGMILIVASESWFGIVCPLTTLESHLRKLAGQAQYEHSFIGDWLGRVLFYQGPDWMFTAVYSAFLLLVILSFILWPPTKKR